jgi:hypothetical protein
MKANEARELSKKAAQKEIDNVCKQIELEIKNSSTVLKLTYLSGGAYSYFVDNGYEIIKDEICLNADRKIIKIYIHW